LLVPGTDRLDLGASSSAGTSGGILEQAWMLKMADEISRKVREEKATSAGAAATANFERDGSKTEFGLGYDGGLGLPPPAYAA